MSDELTELQAENTRLRAALAVSRDPCVYCSLPAERMAACPKGFPGCGRADDLMGCPELGASLELQRVAAERDRLREALVHLHDFAWSKLDVAAPGEHYADLLYVQDRAGAAAGPHGDTPGVVRPLPGKDAPPVTP